MEKSARWLKDAIIRMRNVNIRAQKTNTIINFNNTDICVRAISPKDTVFHVVPNAVVMKHHFLITVYSFITKNQTEGY